MSRARRVLCAWEDLGDCRLRCRRCGREIQIRSIGEPGCLKAKRICTGQPRWWEPWAARWRLATKFARAVGRFLWVLAWDRGAYLRGPEYQARQAICGGCEWQGKFQPNRCGLCGCRLWGWGLVKGRMRTEQCPLRLWPGDSWTSPTTGSVTENGPGRPTETEPPASRPGPLTVTEPEVVEVKNNSSNASSPSTPTAEASPAASAGGDSGAEPTPPPSEPAPAKNRRRCRRC